MPSVNNMTFQQAATLLNSITAQATGKTALTATSTADFISQAQTALQNGYDPLSTAISQVIGRTIFSVRPYSAKFRTIEMTPQRWGAITRKINYLDQDAVNDDRLTLVDGQSVDPWIVKKPKVLETRFYGATQYQRHITIYKDQLDTAFRGPDEFSAFVSGLMSNISDQLEQDKETSARTCVANYIGSVLNDNNSDESGKDRIVHLVTEYNTAAGTNLTSTTVLQPANFVPFVKWMYGRIQQIAMLMSERSALYHLSVGNDTIMRHTPADRMKAIFNTQTLSQIDSSVLSGIFQPEYMKAIDYEPINFWQSIQDPMSVNVTPNYLNASTGAVGTAADAVSSNHVFGILFDEEALGITTMSTWSMATPLNARGGYTNHFYHHTQRWFNDETENFVVLCLD